MLNWLKNWLGIAKHPKNDREFGYLPPNTEYSNNVRRFKKAKAFQSYDYSSPIPSNVPSYDYSSSIGDIVSTVVSDYSSSDCNSYDSSSDSCGGSD